MNHIHGPEVTLLAASTGGLIATFILVGILSYVMGYANGVRLERKRRARSYKESQAFRR